MAELKTQKTEASVEDFLKLKDVDMRVLKELISESVQTVKKSDK